MASEGTKSAAADRQRRLRERRRRGVRVVRYVELTAGQVL